MGERKKGRLDLFGIRWRDLVDRARALSEFQTDSGNLLESLPLPHSALHVVDCSSPQGMDNAMIRLCLSVLHSYLCSTNKLLQF